MGQYTKNGLLNGYKRNNKERAELDYYSTPPGEVENILRKLYLDNNYKIKDSDWILEPCCGGGHMIEGIKNFYNHIGRENIEITGTDFLNRNYQPEFSNIILEYNLDFLDDNYPYSKAPVIIMNPPYATLEPFLIRALEIFERYLIVLCRTQVIEGENRYNNIFINNPPTYIYQYVDRIQCWKNGEKPEGSSAQAYCWLVWDKEQAGVEPTLRWLRRADKA